MIHMEGNPPGNEGRPPVPPPFEGVPGAYPFLGQRQEASGGYEPQKRKLSPGWIVGGIAGILVLLMFTFLCGTCFIFSSIIGRTGYRGDGVGLIELQGVMTASGGGVGFLQGIGTSSQEVVEQLHRAREDDNIKAVLLRIDSPGGTPAAGEEIYREIERTRDEKPVVVSIGDMGASAAYLVASATDHIFASADSDVGSIGVIATIPNYEELNEKIGVEYTIITEGEYKDIGSPYRPVTPQETAIISGQMKVAYDNLIRNIANGRDLEESRVRELATGLTWPGQEAKDLGLIDEIGNIRDAADKAGEMGGIEGDVRLIPLQTTWSPFGIFGEFLQSLKNTIREAVFGDGASPESGPVIR
jgi:protease IV